MSYDHHEYFAFDGMHLNYDAVDIEDDFETSAKDSKANEKKELLLRSVLKDWLSSDNVMDFRNALFKTHIISQLKYMANRYCIFEKIPSSYAMIAINNVELSMLIEQQLSKLNIHLDNRDLNDLQVLTKQLKNNVNAENIYDRVGKIQKFIHFLADKHLGYDASKALDKESMRVSLSACRLVLAIYELRKSRIEILEQEIKINNKQKQSENLNFSMYPLHHNKSTIKNWKLRHLKSILYFLRPAERYFIKNLMEINTELNMVDYLEEIKKLLLNGV